MTYHENREERSLSLKAVLFADAVQYSRLVLENEPAALQLLRDCFELFRDLAARFNGRFIKTTGDGVLLEFGSAVAAVECAIAAQDELVSLNAPLPERRRAHFRVGIHLGEVLHEDGDLYGHIVNVAARLEGYANPGGICISQAVYEQTRQQLALTCKSLGPKRLRNIAEPVIIYQVDPRLLGDDATLDSPIFPTANISVLGHFTLSDSGGNLVVLESPRACALLGYLALSRRFTETRDRLLGLLCSDQPAAQARRGLQTCITQARSALRRIGPDLLMTDRQTLRLALTGVTVDLMLIDDQLKEGEIDDVLLDSAGRPDRILEGLEAVDPAFSSWLHVTRHLWRDRFIEKLEPCLSGIEDDPNVGRKAAAALINIDPTHEIACRRLMVSHANTGNVSAALRLYRDFCKHIEEEFAAVPSEETREVAERIQKGESLTAAPRHSAVTSTTEVHQGDARLPKIELTPIVPQQIDEERWYLLEGFRRDLLTSLIRFRDWVIIEAGTDQAESPSAGANPDYRVDSYCAESHSNVELTVTLVDLRNNRYIWSEGYSMGLNNWLAAQRDIVRKVAAALDIYLSAERVSGRSRDQDISLEAYDDWLRGEELSSRWNAENYERAEHLFKSVMSRMPHFAPGYSSLAGLYNTWHTALPGVFRNKEREGRALQLARQAVEIDPLDTRAQLTLAWSCAMSERFEKANLHYKLAYDLNPNNPRTLISCAQGLAFTGDTEQADGLAAQAQALSPFFAQYQWAYLSAIRFICEDYAGCAEAADWAGHAILDMTGWKTAALSLANRIEEAKSTARLFVKIVGSEWAGDDPCTDEAIVAWFLESFPIKSKQVTDNLRNGLKLAELPV